MRTLSSVAVLFLFLATLSSGCDDTGPAQRPLEGMFTSHQEQTLRWSQADRPTIADLDNNFIYTYEDLPLSGETSRIPWASDYWPTYRDSVNYRWSGPETLSPAEKFAAAFDKPGVGAGVSWQYGVHSQPLADQCSQTSDCEVENGNSKVCAKAIGENTGYCIEDWTGICHAWAPAAIMHPEPLRPVTRNGVEFNVTDLKALVSLAYDKGLTSVFLGTRCNLDLDAEEDGIEYDEYGRPQAYMDANGRTVDCKDTNPGSLHVVLANMVGRHGESLVEDRTVDYQVWNQPIRGYEVLSSTRVTAQEANQLIGVVLGGVVRTEADAMPRGEWRHYGPYDAQEGAFANVTMTGTGDADLYVRFGSQPTAAAYDCRPYAGHADEQCELVVPAGQNQVFVSVYAYRAPDGEDNASFTLSMNIGGQTPDTYILNEDARDFRHVRMRVDWITEAYATLQNNRNLSDSIDDFTRSDTYDYILEMDDADAIIGGEWLGSSKRDHPDFLWVPTMKTEVEVALPPIPLRKESNRAVSEDQWVHFGSVDVSPGEEVRVIMTGTGNGDLYLGLNNQPTSASYACKPTTEDSKEMCGGIMPNGYNRVFISVRGETADTVVNIEAVKFIAGTGITWGEVESLLEESLTVDPCAENNGNCGDAARFTCTNHDGVAVCGDFDECTVNNGDCGHSAFVNCVNREGAAPECIDIDECAENNGGCGDPALTRCTNHVGAPATCEDIDECATDNGGCGDARYITCTNQLNGAPICTDIDECAIDNGGCGPADVALCTNHIGADPTCTLAEIELANPLLDEDAACEIYWLDRTEGFYTNGEYQRNWGGRGEKWFFDGTGASVFILPTGEVIRWDRQSSPPTGTLIAQVDGVVFDDPALLHDAQDIAMGCPTPDAEPSLDVARRAWRFDSVLNFSFSGSYATNWGGRGEKWFINENRAWFYIEPDGTVVRWNGERPIGGTTIGRLSVEYHDSPARLHDAHDPDGLDCENVLDAYRAYDLDRRLDLTFTGSYAENWGGRGERWMHSSANDHWYFMTPDGTVYRWQRNSNPATGTVEGALSAAFHSDPTKLHEAALPTGDFCTGGPAEADLSALAVQTDSELGLFQNRSYFSNWAGLNEKWMGSTSGSWFYLLPNGELYRWTNGAKPVTGELIATFSPEYHTSPAMLHDAADD